MKQYTIIRSYRGREHEFVGTLSALTEVFSYTLKNGASYNGQRGCRKINTEPKSIRSLVTNLNNAEDNMAANGYSGVSYTLKEV